MPWGQRRSGYQALGSCLTIGQIVQGSLARFFDLGESVLVLLLGDRVRVVGRLVHCFLKQPAPIGRQTVNSPHRCAARRPFPAVGQRPPRLSALRVASSRNAGTSDYPLVRQLRLDKDPRTTRCKPCSTAWLRRVLSGASASSIATASRNVTRASDASAAVATL